MSWRILLRPILTLVGESPDFQEESASAEEPNWEHTILLRDADCAAVAIDKLKAKRWRRLLRSDLIDFAQIVRLARILSKRPTILAQSEQSGYVAALSLAVSLSKSRLFILFHGHDWWKRRRRTLAALVRRMPSVHFLCLSNSLRSLVVEEYKIPTERVQVTGFGVDADFSDHSLRMNRPAS